MNSKDQFSKWIETMESALSDDQILLKNPHGMANAHGNSDGECGCGNWDCTVCFPEQDPIQYTQDGQERAAVVTGR